LTKREQQILVMIAEGMTSARIGQQLQLSTNTIVSHRKNLMAKLKLHTTAQVTRFAIDQGLLKPKL
jgi:DNA-binding NarL/FixJ family response regulator